MWMSMSGIQPERAAGKNGMMGLALLGFFSSIVMAYVIAGEIREAVSLSAALLHTSLLWLGLISTAMLSVIIWERKPYSLYFITAGYWLVSVLTMTVILFYLH
jgi:hypothetical protein